MKKKAKPLAEPQGAKDGDRSAFLPELYRSSLGWLPGYVEESYDLSSCGRRPTCAEISAHRGLMMCDTLQVANFSILAGYMEEGATLRTVGRSDVDAGELEEQNAEASFDQLLGLANQKRASAEELVSLFRLLSPYTQANGRCARALWMWRMARGSDTERAQLRSHRAADLWAQEKAWTMQA